MRTILAKTQLSVLGRRTASDQCEAPEDFDSFLWPFVKEMLRLAIGVHAYDILSDDFFALRAFLILVFGDIPAISMIMHMKGHNRLVPCRMCTIRGIC